MRMIWMIMALGYQRHRTPLEDDWRCKPSQKPTMGGAIFIIPNIFGVYRYTWFMIGIATLWLNTPSLLRPIMPSASFGFFSEPMLLGWFAIPRPWQSWIPKGKSSSEPISGSVYVTWKKRAFLPHRIHGAGIYANIGGILMVNVPIYSIHGSYGYWITGFHGNALCSEQHRGCLRDFITCGPKLGMGKPMVLGCLGVSHFFEEHPYWYTVNTLWL